LDDPPFFDNSEERTVKREEEEDWGKCPVLIRSCVMLGRKIGRPKEQGGQGSEV
jgi:hypothetical protein